MKWRRARALALSLVLFVPATAWGTTAAAQPEPGPEAGATNQDKIHSLKEHIQEATVEEGRLLERMEEAEGRKGTLDAKVGELDREIAGVQGELQSAQSRLGVVQAKQQSTEARLQQTRRELQEAKDDLGRQAISAYTGQTEAALWAELLLEAKDIGDLAAKRTYIKAAAGSQAETIAKTETLRNEVQDLRDQLDAARRQAQSERDVVAGQQARLQASRQTQDSVRDQIAAEVTDLDQAKDEIVARKAEFEAEVRAMERESNRIAQTLRQRQAAAPAAPSGGGSSAGESSGGSQPSGGSSGGSRPSGGSPGGGSSGGGSSGGGQSTAPRSGGLVSPIPGAPIVSGYGQRVHPVYGTVRMHTGVDIGASTGTSIRAAGDGVVVTASSMGGYGLATVIDHGGSLATLYGHQSSILVSEGQRVSRGQVIGRVGCTGTCTGPHLHYEVRVNGSPVNPAPYL